MMKMNAFCIVGIQFVVKKINHLKNNCNSTFVKVIVMRLLSFFSLTIKVRDEIQLSILDICAIFKGNSNTN